MKFFKIIIVLFLTFTLTVTVFSSFGQAKQKSNPSPEIFLSKIKEFSKGCFFEGGHNTGSVIGTSTFHFDEFEPSFPKIYVSISLPATFGRPHITAEYGILKNFRFSSDNPKAYNTKIFSADWATNNNSKYGKFFAYLIEDITTYQLFIGIDGYTNWSHWTKIGITEVQYQELVNLLSISDKPKIVQNERIKEKAKAEAEAKVIKLIQANDSAEYFELRKIFTENPIELESFKVANQDFKKMNWMDAKKACEILGNGWRLPTESELKLIIKSLKLRWIDSGYWTSVNGQENQNKLSDQGHFPEIHYKSGCNAEYESLVVAREGSFWSRQEEPSFSRAVRNVTPEEVKEKKEKKEKELEKEARAKAEIEEYYNNLRLKLSTESIELKSIIVSKFDMQRMTYREADSICKMLGNGWRLPNKKELEEIYSRRYKIGIETFGNAQGNLPLYIYYLGYENGMFLTADFKNYGKVNVLSIDNQQRNKYYGLEQQQRYFIRLVKSIK